MTHIATLVCDPAFPILTEKLMRGARRVLPRPQPLQWLDEGVAADIAFTLADRGDSAAALTERLRAALGGAEIDIIVQPARGRRKKLLVADMDSTMIGQECL